jgi:hypothetical protein
MSGQGDAHVNEKLKVKRERDACVRESRGIWSVGQWNEHTAAIQSHYGVNKQILCFIKKIKTRSWKMSSELQKLPTYAAMTSSTKR